MLRLVRGDVRYSCEDVRAMRGRAFDAVSVVDAALACFVVDVEVLKVVVEVNAASTEVATEQSCVGGKDGGHVNMTFANKGYCEASLPFVEVGYDSGVELARDVLQGNDGTGARR